MAGRAQAGFVGLVRKMQPPPHCRRRALAGTPWQHFPAGAEPTLQMLEMRPARGVFAPELAATRRRFAAR